jgi:hypothetical protein
MEFWDFNTDGIHRQWQQDIMAELESRFANE